MAVRPQSACPLPPIPYADWHSFGRTGRTSPMILTNTHFPPPPVKTPLSAIQLTPKIRSHVPKISASPRRELGRTLGEAV